MDDGVPAAGLGRDGYSFYFEIIRLRAVDRVLCGNPVGWNSI